MMRRESAFSNEPQTVGDLMTPDTDTLIALAREGRDAQWTAIYRAIRDYRMSNMRDDIGGGYPLVDLMSNDACSIATGEEEMEMLAGEVWLAIRALTGDTP